MVEKFAELIKVHISVVTLGDLYVRVLYDLTTKGLAY